MSFLWRRDCNIFQLFLVTIRLKAIAKSVNICLSFSLQPLTYFDQSLNPKGLGCENGPFPSDENFVVLIDQVLCFGAHLQHLPSLKWMFYVLWWIPLNIYVLQKQLLHKDLGEHTYLEIVINKIQETALKYVVRRNKSKENNT